VSEVTQIGLWMIALGVCGLILGALVSMAGRWLSDRAL